MRSLFRQLWFPFTEGFKPTPPSLLSLSLCQCSHFEIRPQKIHSLAGHLASPKTGPDTSRPFGTTQADQHSSSAADSRAAIGFHGLRPSDTASVDGVSWEPASGLFFGTPYCCWYSLFPKSRFVPLSLSVSSRPCQSSLSTGPHVAILCLLPITCHRPSFSILHLLALPLARPGRSSPEHA